MTEAQASPWKKPVVQAVFALRQSIMSADEIVAEVSPPEWREELLWLIWRYRSGRLSLAYEVQH